MKPPTDIAPFREPFSARNNKKSDDLTKNSWIVISKKLKGRPLNIWSM